MRGFRDIRRTSDVTEKFPTPSSNNVPMNTEDLITRLIMDPSVELPDDSGDHAPMSSEEVEDLILSLIMNPSVELPDDSGD